MADRYKSNNTRRVIIGALRRLIKLTDADQRILRALQHTGQASPREVIVSEVDYERALRCAPPWLELILLVCHETGLRVGTACKLARINVDLENHRLVGKTKGDIQYDLPMTQRLEDRIRWFCVGAQTSTEPLAAAFRVARRAPSTNSAGKALAVAKRRAGVTAPWGCHDLRRTLARKLWEQTGDIHKVQKLLGHRWLSTTCWYLGNAVDAPNKATLTKAANGLAKAANGQESRTA